jgi:hypothetical protein
VAAAGLAASALRETANQTLWRAGSRYSDSVSARRCSFRPPQHLALAYDNSSTPVIYPNQSLAFNYDLFSESPLERIVIESDSQPQQIRELRAWIRQRARALLPQRLDEISRRTGLDFRRVTIRSQKTRWGSCSSRGHIQFWQLVESRCPDYRSHEKLLSRSRNLVPDWFLMDLFS